MIDAIKVTSYQNATKTWQMIECEKKIFFFPQMSDLTFDLTKLFAFDTHVFLLNNNN